MIHTSPISKEKRQTHKGIKHPNIFGEGEGIQKALLSKVPQVSL